MYHRHLACWGALPPCELTRIAKLEIVLVLVLALVIEKSSAPRPRRPEQNNCGKIGPSSRCG